MSNPTELPDLDRLKDEHEAFEEWARNHLGQGYPLTMDEHVYEHPVTRWAFKAWKASAALAAQQAAEPGALDADELTRLRRLLTALGHADAFELSDEYVRGELCHVLGLAAGKLERAALAAVLSAPGTPEAPQPPFQVSDDEMAALRRFWECASDGEGYDVEKTMMQRLAEMGLVQRKSGAHYMVTEFGLYVLREYTVKRAAQLDGGQEGSGSNG